MWHRDSNQHHGLQSYVLSLIIAAVAINHNILMNNTEAGNKTFCVLGLK